MGTVKISILEQDGVELDVATEIDLIDALTFVGAINNKKTTSNLTNNSNSTYVNIAEHGIDCLAGKIYRLSCLLMYTSSATTNGLSLAFDGTAVGLLSAHARASSSRTAALLYSTVAKNSPMTFTATATTTSTELCVVDLVFICTSGGTLYPKFRSEVGGQTIVIKGGSVLGVSEL